MPSTDEEGRPRSFPPNAIHLVRTSQQMQLQLSQMADQKASMLMGAASLVFTISVGQMRSGASMMLPIALLASSAFLAALFSIVVVMPTITRANPAGLQPGDNLLFFGIFATVSEGEFIDHILDRIESDEDTYRTMLRDMHQAGTLLQRKKYRYLGYAYRIFLTGMVMTAIAAVLELVTGRFV